jgi:hypothetical protein
LNFELIPNKKITVGIGLSPLGSQAYPAKTAQQQTWPHLTFRPVAENRGGRSWLPTTPSADSGEPEVQDHWERGRGATSGRRNRIEGVGEVGGSPTRLSAMARIERGEAMMRGQRGGPGRSWKGRRDDQRGVELVEVTVGQRVARGGGARWTGVQWSASAWHEEKKRQGVSQRRGRKGGAHWRDAPLIATRGGGNGGWQIRWLRGGGCGPGTGGTVVRTGRLTGGPRRF